MAQLVERLVRNEEASGSNPLSSTTKGRLLPSLFFVVKLSDRSVRCIISGSREEANASEFIFFFMFVADDTLA